MREPPPEQSASRTKSRKISHVGNVKKSSGSYLSFIEPFVDKSLDQIQALWLLEAQLITASTEHRVNTEARGASRWTKQTQALSAP